LKAIVDTNVLIRMFTHDHPTETPKAEAFLRSHEVVVTNQTLCELVWVLRRAYNFTSAELQTAIRYLAETESITLDRSAVNSGLSFLAAGGDFADGVIAFEGRLAGGQTFATFDKKAATILRQSGFNSLLLSDD
jgi:predicted nucleic-acid-binding protein